MTVGRARAKLPIIVTAVLLAVLLALPVHADTSSDLGAARKRAAQVQSELDRATAAYQAAVTRYSETQDRLASTQSRIDETRARLARYSDQLSARARTAYERGGAGTLELLLSAASFSDFSDRVQFLNRLSQGDSDLIVRARVTREELGRAEADLAKLSREQADTAAALQHQQAAIDAKFRELSALAAKLQDKLDSERAAAASVSKFTGGIVQGGALQACPVAGPRSYSDDFGAPRPGGRTHQGNDILAPRGTPVVAAFEGAVSRHPNDLGGNALFVTRGNGDYTYYAHLDSYVGGEGSVSAGQQIGTVGDSGNAKGGPTHLHFEYHPGGGAAIDPYPYLKAVCG